jgi:uncharacterized delta-60 repeat protein
MCRPIRAVVLLLLLVCPGSALARPGSLDPTFGTAGTLQTAKPISALALESDGKILALSYDGLTRYLPDGTAAETFGVRGSKIVLQPDGAILVWNTSLGPLVRYTSDGTLDATFGSGGIITSLPLTLNPGALALQPDGKILVAGSPGLTVLRLNSDGSLDGSFGNGGVASNVPNANTEALAIESNGSMLLPGERRDLAAALLLGRGPARRYVSR